MIETNSTENLHAALAKAQGQFKTPTLNRTAKIKNAQGQLLYETHYADLQECFSCVKEALSANGLSFTQTIDFIHEPKEMWVLRLTLRHSSGALVNSVLPLNVNQSPQQLGGALTYFKRYQFSAFFGLAADFDDDGNAAEDKGRIVDGSKKEPKPTTKPQASQPPKTKPPQTQAAKPPVHPDEPPQQFPPDDTEKKPAEPEPNPNDPGEFVILFGNTTTGKKVRQINEADLKSMMKWVDGQLKVTPPVSNMSHLFAFNMAAKGFLKSVGVEV